MNEFCKVCGHKDIPWFLKEKFNVFYKQKVFDECPMNDPKVAGCLVSRLNIDWQKFSKYLEEHSALTKEQLEKLNEMDLMGNKDES